MIHIYSVHYNRPDFIPKQIRSFEKYLKSNYTFTVIDNSESDSIELACKNVGISYIKNESAIRTDASKMHCSGLSIALSKICQQTDLCMILDHDMFLCQELDIVEYMQNYDLAFFLHTYNSPVTYIWPGIVILNPTTLPTLEQLSLNTGQIEGIICDSGAESYYYLNQYRDSIRIKYLEGTPFSEHLLNEEFYIFDKAFLHYFRGSNWIGHSSDITVAKDSRLDEILK